MKDNTKISKIVAIAIALVASAGLIVAGLIIDKKEPSAELIPAEEKSLELIAMNIGSLSADEGATEILEIYYRPGDTTDDRTVTWTSSDDSVVAVEPQTQSQNADESSTAKITCLKAGTAVITAAVGEQTTQCTVDVASTKPEEPQILSVICMNVGELTVSAGETGELIVYFDNPAAMKGKSVEWLSSAPDIVTVEEKELGEYACAVVHAEAAGTAVVSACVDGLTTSCTVLVQPAEN